MSALSVRQFRLHVVRPTLHALELWSPAAEALVIGTAVHESGGLKFIDQVTGPNDDTLGPAYGFFQIERGTYEDLTKRFLEIPKYHRYRNRLSLFRSPEPDPLMQLAGNHFFSAAVCRLIYYSKDPPLPDADDLPALAAYWKLHYNTPEGKGTESQWMKHYREYVK